MDYSRQCKLDFIPKDFQKNIKNKKIVVVGCGGIGSVLCEILVRGGFLNLILVDFDLVDLTNLQRQIFIKEDVGTYKVEALKKRLLRIDENVSIKKIVKKLDKKNVLKICFDCDLVIDCCDNFETSKIINSFCEKNKKDFIYNGAVKCEIMSCVFFGKEKNFSKIFPKKVIDEKCCEVGVLCSTTFTSASICYNLVLKYFLNKAKNEIIKFDMWKNKFYVGKF